MASSLSNLINNLSEGIHKIKYKYRHDGKICETCRNKFKYCNCSLEHKNFKDNLAEYRCLCSKQNYQQKFDEKLKERFFNTYKFSNHDNNRLIFWLQKGAYPYEYGKMVPILMNSMKQHYLKKKIFTAT